MRLGVLDVGSNTVHLLVVDAHPGAAPLPASSDKIELRLAEHLGPDGSVDDEAVALLLSFIHRSLEIAEDLGVTEIMAFATSALRDAPNGQQVLDLVRDQTGVELSVLSGEDEARLTFLAVRRWYGWSSGRLLVLDIGGGSLEIAAGADEFPDVAVSVPLGAGRLTRAFLSGDPPHSSEVRALRREARAQVAGIVGRVARRGETGHAVATSKTFRSLARIAGAAPSSEGPYARRVLDRDDLHEVVERIAGMTAKERATLPGVSESRSRQLLAGAVVASAAMDLLSLPQVEICPWALREGVILRRLDGLEE